MIINLKKFSIKTTFAVCCSIILSACGGGDSNSGGGSAPVVVAPVIVPFAVGVYNGTLTSTLEGLNIVDGGGTESFVLEAQGEAGNQQVRIAYAQFSGTSSIGLDGEFSIPSGSFPIRITDSNNQVVSTCLGELTFDGTFAVNDTVSGNVTTTKPFVCDDSRFGPLTLTGTFEATQGAAKFSGFRGEVTVRALNL